MKTSRSGLFLIELILSIFFFIVAAAIAMQLFVKSHFISEDTININHALLYTQNIADIFLAADGDFAAVREAFSPEIVTDISTVNAVLYFDKDWQPLSAQTNAAYMVLMDFDAADKENRYACLNIYVNKYSDSMDLSNNSIHHQEVKKYVNSIPGKEHGYRNE